MRWYRGDAGDQRLWFEPDEIETIIEDELRRAEQMPTVDHPVADLERFVEHHLGSPLDQYADLAPDVLGVTEFRRGQPPLVSINRDLTGSALDGDDSPPGLRGRWRATVAHEATHVVLHRVLFELDEHQGSLFPEPAASRDSSLMRCLKRDVGYGTSVRDWREIQANRGMAAMLMPRRVFERIARRELVALGVSRSGLRADDAVVTDLVRRLAERFEVSRQAASIRLGTLGFVGGAQTLSLPTPPTS